MTAPTPSPHPPSRRSRRAVLAGGAVLLGAALAGCADGGSPGSAPSETKAPEGASVVVGAASFPESQVIANLYAGSLRARGFDASVTAGLGTREAYMKALRDGKVDLVPDYSGNLLVFLDPKATEKSAGDVTRALAEKTPNGLTVLPAAQAENTDSLVVTAVTAEKYKLASLEDLGRVCGKLALAAPAEFAKRPGGLPGLKETYGCEPKSFTAVEDGGGPQTVNALTSDAVQVADIFSTSPAIDDNGLVALEDTKHNWAAQQVVPVGRTAKMDDAAKAAIAQVQSKLTTADLVDLNRKVSGHNKISPAEAAAEWLKSKGIAK